MAVIMGVLAPVRTFAADGKYVSDVMVYQAGSFEEAKAGLEGLGYEIVKDGNLNATLSTGVYLGYKTTDDPSEAVTDIAAMNMTGNYSYSDYEELMKKHRNRIMNTIRGFETALAEFQTNFTNGRPEAQMAYDSLNLFRDDDSGALMGDLLLDYDFSQAAQEQLTDKFMQASSDIVMSIMQNVAMASDPSENSMLERLSASGPGGVTERYMSVYISTAKAQEALEADLGAAEAVLRIWWDTFYHYLLRVEADDFVMNPDGLMEVRPDALSIESAVHPERIEGLEAEDKEYLTSLSKLTTDSLKDKAMQDVTLYMMLAELPYGEGSMLDLFKRPLAEVSQDDLYSVVDAMSKGQRGQLEILGLRAILLGAGIELDKNAAESQQAVDENAAEKQNIEPVSIYQGVDRSVFTEGVALTGSAVQHEQQSGDNWISELTGIDMTDQEYQAAMGIVISSVAAVGTLAAGITASYVEGKLIARAQAAQSVARQARIAAEKEAWETVKNNYYAAQKAYHDAASNAKKTKDLEISIINRLNTTDKAKAEMIRRAENSAEEYIRSQEEAFQNAMNELKNAASPNAAAGSGRAAEEAIGETGIRAAKITKCVSFVLFAIAMIVDIYFIYEFFSAEGPEEESIPHHMLAAINTEYGEDYVYYAAVRDQNGNAADVNNHEADPSIGWLVLYATHEKTAGKPVLVSNLRVLTGSHDVPEDSAFVHLFDQTGAINLTDSSYTGANDGVNGTYLLFSRDMNAFAGSAFSVGLAAVCAAGGLILGFAGGCATAVNRKKKKAAAA